MPRPSEPTEPLRSASAGPSDPTASRGRTGPETPDSARILGDYEILEEIARGGMGVVYRARQRSLGRIVAVKRILAGGGAGSEEIERFRREARAAASLQHPSIVAIHEVGEAEGLPYFSMDYVDGPSLGELARKDPPSPDRAAGILLQIAEAVHYAHERGILHRDLKPSNVLIDGTGRPRIMDFGLARTIESGPGLTASGVAVGTPAYMPPEQARGDRSAIGRPSDVYSLGAILYEMLTGRPPFRADTAIETMRQVVDADAIRPRLLSPWIDRDLETICLKCLEKTPPRRYPTAGALAADLRRYLEHRPIAARPVGRVARLWRACRRRPVVAALSAALSLAVIAGVVAVAWQWRQAERARILAETARESAQKESQLARAAREEAQDHLARSLFDQARAVLAGGEPGRRWETLELLARAERLRRRERPAPAGTGTELPSDESARSLAAAALRLPDVRLGWERPLPQTLPPTICAGGQRVVSLWLDMRRQRTGIVLLDAEEGRELLRTEDDRLWITAIALDRDGGRLARSSDGTVSIFEGASQKPFLTLEGPRGTVELGGLSFAPYDRHLLLITRLSPAAAELRLWDLATQPAPPSLARAEVPAVRFAWSPDGGRLVFTAGERALDVLDVPEGRVSSRFDLPIAIAGAPCFSPDGTALAVPCQDRDDDRGTILFLDSSTGAEKDRLRIEGPLRGGRLSFSPRGELLASCGSEGTVRVHRLGDRREVLRFWTRHPEGAVFMDWQGETHLLTAGHEGRLRRWETTWDVPESIVPLARPARALAFDPSGGRLALAGRDGDVAVLLFPSGRVERELEGGRPASLVFDPSGRRLAGLSRRSAVLWELESGSVLAQLEAPDRREALDSLAFGPDGKARVTRSGDGRLRIEELGPGSSGPEDVEGAATGRGFLDPSGRLLAVLPPIGEGVGPVRLLDLEAGREIGELSPGGDESQLALFDARGRWVLVQSIEGSFGMSPLWIRLSVWPVGSPSDSRSIPTGALPSAYAFDATRPSLAVGFDDGSMEIWLLEPFGRLLRWKPYDGPVVAIAFTPDGRSLLTSDGRAPALLVLDLDGLGRRLTETVGLGW